MDVGNGYMEYICKPSHFQRIVLQNGAEKFVQRDVSMTFPPDVEADTDNVSHLRQMCIRDRLRTIAHDSGEVVEQFWKSRAKRVKLP